MSHQRATGPERYSQADANKRSADSPVGCTAGLQTCLAVRTAPNLHKNRRANWKVSATPIGCQRVHGKNICLLSIDLNSQD